MFIRSPYNYDADVVSYQTGLDFSESPSRAEQHFRDETDINVMVARFQRTGIPEPVPTPPGVQDFEHVHDFRSAMQAIIDARMSFASLPSDVRERFQNDPGRMLAFVHDDANYDEAVRLGLAKARVVPDVKPVDEPDPSAV